MKKHWSGDGFEASISDLLGQVFTKVDKSEDDAELSFTCDDGVFVFLHYQSCCESVYINDITGDLFDLVGSPLLVAEEAINENIPETHTPGESETWTFYKFATIKGYVDVRWLGESNGYYGEDVDLKFIPASKVQK